MGKIATKKYLIYCIILALFLQTSCKSGSSGNNKNAPTAREIKLIEVPTMMSDPESRSKYVSEHFWNNFDFSDSAYLTDTLKLRNHLATYLQVRSIARQDIANKSLVDFINRFMQGNVALKSYFPEEVSNILYDPNSMGRNETMYIVFLDNMIASRYVDEATKGMYSFQLNLALKNRPGNKAVDFQYIDSKNKLSSLYKTQGEYILLFFFEPGCPSCNTTKLEIEESPAFKAMGKKLTYLAVYSGEDLAAWEDSFSSYPSNWIVAHDIGQELVNDNLYDMRASPTMYLLDKDHKVLLKDPDFFQLNNYLSALQQ